MGKIIKISIIGFLIYVTVQLFINLKLFLLMNPIIILTFLGLIIFVIYLSGRKKIKKIIKEIGGI